MKKLITKSLAFLAFLLLSAWNVNAQTTTYSGTFPITLQGFAQVYTAPVAAGWAGTTSAPTSSDRSGKCFTTATDPNVNTGKNFTYRLPYCGTITLQANGTVGRGFIVTVTKVTGGAQVSRIVWAYSNATCSSQNFVVNVNEPVNVTILSPSAVEGAITSTGSSYISYVNISPLPTPTISSFTAAGITATINESTTPKTIIAVLPYGTNMTAITPTVTIGGSATSYTPAGAQDFSAGAVNYVVTDGASTPASTTYAVTLTASTVANTDATLSDLKVDGTTVTGFNASTLTYDVVLPYVYSGTPAVTSTVNAITSTQVITQASAIPGSATVTVTAQDNSQKVYTVNFTRTPISTANDITSFSINGKTGVITGQNILVQMHLTTNVTSLTPAVVVSNLATITPSGAQDFTNPVNYVVTAQDGTQKTYTVTVQLLDLSYTGTYPYITNFPSGYTIPVWMSSPTGGVIFTDPYTGSDKTSWYDNTAETTAATASVIRFNSATSMDLLVSQCGTVTAKVSATGGRTYNLYINGVLANSATGTTNSMATLTASPNLTTPTTIRIENPATSGGITLGYLEIDAPVATGLSQSKLGSVTFDGQIIQNPSNVELQVFDTTGRLMVHSSQSINMGTNSKGVYIVKSATGTIKIALVK